MEDTREGEGTWVENMPSDIAQLVGSMAESMQDQWDRDVLAGLSARQLWPTESDFSLGALCEWDPHQTSQARNRVLATGQAVAVQALLRNPQAVAKALTWESLEGILSGSALVSAADVTELCRLAEVDVAAARKSALGPGSSYVRCPSAWVREAYEYFVSHAEYEDATVVTGS